MKVYIKNLLPFNNREEMPAWQFVVKKVLAFFLCYFVGLVLAEGIVILLHFPFGKNMLVGDVFSGKTITLITYYGYIVMAGVSIFYWKKIEKKPLSQMGFDKRGWGYLLGVGASALLVGLCLLFAVLVGDIRYEGVGTTEKWWYFLLLAGGFAVQGATEELLSRGVVLHALKERLPLWVALTVSSVLFALPHLDGLLEAKAVLALLGIVNLLLISLIFSFLTLRFGLWSACGLHAGWNFLLYAVLGLNVSGIEGSVGIFHFTAIGETVWNGGAYGLEASLLTAVILSMFATLSWWIWKKQTR